MIFDRLYERYEKNGSRDVIMGAGLSGFASFLYAGALSLALIFGPSSSDDIQKRAEQVCQPQPSRGEVSDYDGDRKSLSYVQSDFAACVKTKTEQDTRWQKDEEDVRNGLLVIGTMLGLVLLDRIYPRRRKDENAPSAPQI